MVDTPTTRNRFRKQETGTNNNTWGTKLNEVIDCIDQVVDGVETINLTSSANYTLTTTNYTTADEAKNRILVFTGALVAAATVIIPSVEHWYLVVNKCGQTLTVKTSAGSGVSIPDDRSAHVYCDGSGALNGSPTFVGTGFTPSNNGDTANKLYVDVACAAAAIPGANGTVKVDAAAGSLYLGQALTDSGDIIITDNGDTLDIGAKAYWSAPVDINNTNSPYAAQDRDIIKVLTSTGAVTVNLPATGRVWIVDDDGDSDVNNITVNPPGSDTVTINTIDLPHFSGIWEKNGTNWGIR